MQHLDRLKSEINESKVCLKSEKLVWFGKSKKQLDEYLAKGWFRARQEMFTTHFLNFNSIFYDAIWLRYSIDQYEPSPNRKKRLTGVHEQYKIEFSPFCNSSALESLFQKYKKSVDFETSEDLGGLLQSAPGAFETMMVTIKDNGHLIGVGIFDRGETALQGIVNVYHPGYCKQSIGQILMQLKFKFAKENGFKWYYPGYMVPGNPKFAYKTLIAQKATEWFNTERGIWKPLSEFNNFDTPLYNSVNALKELQIKLNKQEIETVLTPYRYFDSSLWFPSNQQMISEPAFLYNPKEINNGVNEIYVFNPMLKCYEKITYNPILSLEAEKLDHESTLGASILENLSRDRLQIA